MNKQIKITLIKSLIGRLPKHKIIANQLGLKKLNHSVVHTDIPSIRGMINVIEYMLRVEECV
jgi:large subunit ribosomal protein L30